jgi:hypothetical protein
MMPNAVMATPTCPVVTFIPNMWIVVGDTLFHTMATIPPPIASAPRNAVRNRLSLRTGVAALTCAVEGWAPEFGIIRISVHG